MTDRPSPPAEQEARRPEAQLEEVLEAGREMERRWQEAEAQLAEAREALKRMRDLSFSAFSQAYPIEGPDKLREQFRQLAHFADRALQATQEDGA